MKVTKFLKKEDYTFHGGELAKKWYLIDAEGHTLGRLASQVAMLLRGKNKAYFTPHVDCGDYVVVINAAKIKLSGKKMSDKIYYHHTGYPGGIKKATALEKLEKDPTSLIYSAVKGMMPKNTLNRKSIHKLKVYAGDDHKHFANKPEEFKISYKPSDKE